MIVVESPSGRRENDEKMKTNLSPPVTATRNKNIKVIRFLSPQKLKFLYMATTSITAICKAPRMTTTCKLSISSSILIMLEYAVISTPDMKANKSPRDRIHRLLVASKSTRLEIFDEAKEITEIVDESLLEADESLLEDRDELLLWPWSGTERKSVLPLSSFLSSSA